MSIFDTHAFDYAVARTKPGKWAEAPSLSTDTTDELIYEEWLNADSRWALSEGSRHFEGDSAVFGALHNIAERLAALRVSYAVVGGMALFQHGLRRFTEDVDILVTNDDLKIIHEKLEGLDYRPPFPNSKHLRDTHFGVKIEFLTTGGYQGDGKQKPVSFPDPKTVNFEADGIYYVNLKTLIELKLASGMTNAGRLKDLSDILELIKIRDLPADFANQLSPFVRDKYDELWQQARTRFVRLWRSEIPASAASITAQTSFSPQVAAGELARLRDEGLVVEAEGSINAGYAKLVTTDAQVAETYGFIEESEFWDVSAE